MAQEFRSSTRSQSADAEPSYVQQLDDLVSHCSSRPCTPLIAQGRIAALALMNMRWELCHSDMNLTEHPYSIASRLVGEARNAIVAWDEIGFAESENVSFDSLRKERMEDMHQDLFQRLWTLYDIEEYKKDRIARYEHRIDINGIGNFIAGSRCIDFGCGHGNFAHAMLSRGAAQVTGIDFGDDSLRHAEKMRDLLGVSPEKLRFRKATVYDTGEAAEAYDFAVQNGVFHHLDDEDKAYREVHRVLKKGGWFWVYTVGAGAIIHTMYDRSRLALQNIPPDFIVSELRHLNFATGKRYQLGDSMIAVYRFTDWEELTARLGRLGFGNFRRMVGGFPGDFGHDVIAKDKYGTEKFGAGDLRLVCQKL